MMDRSGKAIYFHQVSSRGKEGVIAMRLETPNGIRDLQRGHYLKAKRDTRIPRGEDDRKAQWGKTARWV